MGDTSAWNESEVTQPPKNIHTACTFLLGKKVSPCAEIVHGRWSQSITRAVLTSVLPDMDKMMMFVLAPVCPATSETNSIIVPMTIA